MRKDLGSNLGFGTFFQTSVLQNEAEISVFRGREMCSGDQNKINVFRGERCFGEERSVPGIRIR